MRVIISVPESNERVYEVLTKSTFGDILKHHSGPHICRQLLFSFMFLLATRIKRLMLKIVVIEN